MAGFSYVLFDLDNTLFDRAASVRRRATRLYHSDVIDQSTFGVGEATATYVELDRDGHAPDKVAFFGELGAAWGPMRRSAAELATWYATARLDGVEPDAHVLELLADMARWGVRWGIVSNGPASQLEKARRLHLEEGAACILISEVFGAAKPDASIFEAARDEPTGEYCSFVELAAGESYGQHTRDARRSAVAADAADGEGRVATHHGFLLFRAP